MGREDTSSATQQILRWRWLRGTRAAVTGWLLRSDRILSHPAAWAASVLGLMIFQGLLIFTHRAWLDEYQAVQIAVEAPDLATLLNWLSYEGHPPLWYLLLRGLAYLMDPLWALPVAAALCALVTQSAILFASPFTRTERLLIASSQFILFEYLTVSRSLSLGAAAMFLAIAMWRRRGAWFAIAILPMCDFLFGVVSLCFVAIKLRDRALWWPGAAVWIASGLLAAWSVVPAPDVHPAISSGNVVDEIVFWALTMSNLLVPWQGALTPQWNTYPIALVVFWGWAAFICFAWKQTSPDRLYKALLMGMIALTFVFSLTIYRLSARHLMLIALLLIALTWRMREQGALPRAGFRLWIAVAAGCGLFTGVFNLVRPFDGAPEVARRIDQLGLADAHWVVFPVSRAQGISALTGIDFERTEQHCMQSFVRWDHHSRLTTNAAVAAYFRREAQAHGRGYLLTDIPFANMPQDVLQPLEAVHAGYDGQPFYIYVIGRHMAQRPVSLPPCVTGRRPLARF